MEKNLSQMFQKIGDGINSDIHSFSMRYFDKFLHDFKEKTGIDIRTVKHPSQVQGWNQFRCDLITRLVNRLAKSVHSKGKKINAAVFPGTGSVAIKTVRQEWNKWDLDAVFPMDYNDFYAEGPDWISERGNCIGR